MARSIWQEMFRSGQASYLVRTPMMRVMAESRNRLGIGFCAAAHGYLQIGACVQPSAHIGIQIQITLVQTVDCVWRVRSPPPESH